MSPLQTALQVCLRWLDFVGLTTLVGSLAFRCAIIQPRLLSHRLFERFEKRLRGVEAGSLVIVALTSVGDLIMRTLLMSGGGLGDLGVALPVVFRQTHFGVVWISRIGFIGLLGLVRHFGKPEAPGHSWSAVASFLGATAIALTTSLSGHSGDWGDLRLPVLIDWLHLLAISTWTGGLFTLGFVLRASLPAASSEDQAQGLVSIARRFSRMAGYCAAGFLATGFYNTWIQVTSLLPLFTTAYGRTLLVKLSLVLLVLMIAVLNRYYFLALLGSTSGAPSGPILGTIGRLGDSLLMSRGHKGVERIQQQFFRSVRLEWLVAVGALLCTALLTQLPPARHIRSHQHREEHALHQPPQRPATAKHIAAREGVLREMNSPLFPGGSQ